MHFKNLFKRRLILIVTLVMLASFLINPIINLIPSVFAAPYLNEKWRQTTGVPFSSIGALVADVTGDSHEEIIVAGLGGVIALDSDDGHIIWSQDLAGLGSAVA